MENIVREIFKTLDGCKCRVKSGGLLMQGSIEGECILSYNIYMGLYVSIPLEWNDNKPQVHILPILNGHLPAIQKEEDKHLAPISFDARDQLQNRLYETIKNIWVTAGLISFRGVKDIKINGRGTDNSIYSVTITYEQSTIEIYTIKPPKVLNS